MMNLKILVVDDDEIIVFLHNMLLQDTGMSADSLCFENGKEALEYLNTQTDSNTASLILLDINMPVMNGWQLLDRIQASSFANNTFVVMVTSSIDFEDREKAKQYTQVIGYFEKPLNEKSLKKIQQLSQISPYFNNI